MQHSAKKRPRGNPDATKPYRWKPGESGNPSGGPKYATVLSKAYRAQLAQLYPNDPEGRTWAAVIAAHLAQLALSRKANEAIAAVQELCDRTEGKAHMSLSVGRQETEQVSILELFNQQFESAAIGPRDDGATGNGGSLTPGTTAGSGALGGGEAATE